MNPTNKFDGFFDGNGEIPQNVEMRPPTVQMMVHTLIVLTGTTPEWYKIEKNRIIACSFLEAIADGVKDFKDGKEKDAPISLSEAAFLMMTSEIIFATQQFASDEERKRWPDRPDTVSDEDEEEDE